MGVDSGLVQIIARQNEKKKEERDPFNIIMKGLSVANQVYGIKQAGEQFEALKQQNLNKQKQAEFSNKVDLASKGLKLDESGNVVEDKESSFYQQRIRKGEPDPYSAQLKQLQIEQLRAKGEQTKKAGITPGQKSVDANFAKDYVDWNAAGGIAGVENQLEKLEGATQALTEDQSLTGVGKGLAGSLGIRSITNPKAVEIKQQVENAVNASLRATLGAAFTEKEGQRIMSQTYDESLPPEANIRKIQSTISQLRRMAQDKDAASRYFEENGSLAGFKPASERSAGPVKKSSEKMNDSDFAAEELAKRRGLKSAIPKGK